MIATDKLLTLDQAIGLNQKEVRTLYHDYVNPGLANMMGLIKFDKRFARAEGVSVWDENGERYLDFLGGYGALNFGHNHPAISEAVRRVDTLPNLLQAALGPLYAALAHNLAQVAPPGLSRSFFGNSGAEAVEGALKLARAATKKHRIIYCEHSFHGKSFGALSVTGKDKYQEPFKPLLPGCERVPYGETAALERKLAEGDVAAMILEPIQGEGGVIIPPDGYLTSVRELCTKYQALLIIDEIQTGFARTGTNFACQREGVTPDIMCVGKSLGGGIMPISAFITTPQIWDQAYGGFERCMLHTSTFGGNARACAAGIAAIELMVTRDLAAEAGKKGAYLIAGLQKLQEKYPSFIKEVRGRGLLVGLEFNQVAGSGSLIDRLTGGKLNQLAGEYMAALVAGELMNKYHIITAYTLNNPNVIRFEPPLIVTSKEIDHLLNSLEKIFQESKSLWKFVLASSKHLINVVKPV